MKRWTNWQDWSTAAIGGLLVLTPFGLATANTPRCTLGNTAWFHSLSTLDAWILGIVVVGVSLLALYSPGSGVTVWVRIVAGVWLFFAPWILGFVSDGASAWVSRVAGVLVALLVTWQVLGRRARAAVPSL